MSTEGTRYPRIVTTTDKRSAKRAAIMESATRLFSARGFQATRMQDIADELGMQAGSLYYYFPSKEAVLGSIVEANVGAATEALAVIVGSEGSAVGRVRAAIESHLAVFAEQPDLYAIFVSEKLDAISPELAAHVDDLGRRYEQLWVQLLEHGIATGELRSDLEPWVAMKAVVGMCNSTLFWFSEGGRLKATEVAAAFTALALEGLKAP